MKSQSPVRQICFAIAVAAFLTRPATVAGAPPSQPIEAAPVKLGHPVDFEKDVYPILENNCLACHNAGIAESKLSVETADSIRKGGKRGPAVVPKNLAASVLFQLASHAGQPAMPPLPNTVDAKALSPQELGILKQWILEGAKGGAASSHDSTKWQPVPASMHSIECVALSPWGRFAAAGRTNQIVIYDLILGQESARLVDPALSDVQFEGRPMYPEGAADRDFIHAVSFSPDGSLLAAGGYRVVKLWRRPQNVGKWKVVLPERPTGLAVNRAGSLIAVATEKNVELRAASGGAFVRKLSGVNSAVTSLAFSPDGKTLYAGSPDKSWRSWSAADGAPRQAVTTPAAISAIAIDKAGSQIFTAGADGVIRVWSLKPAKSGAKAPPIREMKGHAKGVTSLALVLPAGDQLVSGGEDGSVRVWEIKSGKQLVRVDHGGPVTAISVRPDGQVIASAGANGVARLWSIKGGAALTEMKGDLSADHHVQNCREQQSVAAQHIGLTDAHVKAAEQEIKDRQDGVKKTSESRKAEEKALADSRSKEKATQDALAAAQKALKAKPADAALKKKVDESTKAVAVASDAIKAADSRNAGVVRAHEGAEQALRIATERLDHAKRDKAAAEATKKEADHQLAVATAAAAGSMRPLHGLTFSADGKVFATGGDQANVQLWDAKSGRPLQIEAGTSAIGRLAFVGNSTVLSAADDRSLTLWETNPAWSFVGRIGPKADAPLETGSSSFVGRVLCLAFNTSGTLLATGGGEPSRSGELKLWNIPALTFAREIKDAHSDTVFGVEFSRDGKYLASGAADKFLKVFDVGTGKFVRSFEGHTNHVLGVSWKADGSTLASAGADNQIKIWNFETGEQTRSITTYPKQVTSIHFIGTEAETVSAGGDKTVRFHQATDGDNYRTFEGGTDYMYSAAAARDGSVVVGAGEDGVLRVWNGKNGQSLMTFPPPVPHRNSAQASAGER
jgi:WD40 repeat protein